MAIGVFVLIYADEQREKNNILLGLFILLSSVPPLLAFFTNGGFKINEDYTAYTYLGTQGVLFLTPSYRNSYPIIFI